MITYKTFNDTDVYTDGRHSGVIRQGYSEKDGSVDYIYYPDGHKQGGESFATLRECKKSLE